MHLGHGLDARAYALRHSQGLEPDRSPYGFAQAESPGWTVTFSEDGAECWPMMWWRRVVRRLLGFDLVHAWRNRATWRRADIIWTVQESEWLAVACWRRLGLRCPPVVGNSVWLFNHPSRLGWVQRRLAAWLGRQQAVLPTVHSAAAAARAAQQWPGLAPELLLFGICCETFTPPPQRPTQSGDTVVAGPTSLAPRLPPRRIRLFAAGNDRTRDWATLLAAFGDDDRFEVRVWSGTLDDHALRHCRSVRRAQVHSMQDSLALYAWCDFVVVPMVVNDYAGITVALEATAMHKPLIVARTGGVPTYLAEDEAFWYAPGDAGDLVQCALRADDAPQRERVAAKAWARFVAEDYSTRGMVQRYQQATARALNRSRCRR